ncbi:DUF5723 family protein [Reichenbachiella sp. MALMAid0571]|uniref:DUF5723 family protein n=1 Tax=Reichenbachiella sp. MALMAid0571 TaxID=3143939 RepID=UPI0032DEE634
MKIYIVLFITVLLAFTTKAQNDLTFYHMGKATPQANHLNPSFFPDSKVYVSLPAISGINLSLNNSFSYNDVIVDVPGEDSVKLDIDNLLSKLKKGNNLNFSTTISLLQVGVRLKDYGAITFFANERAFAGMSYPVNLLEYAWRGSGDYVGKKLIEDEAKVNATYFREIGVGYAHQLEVLGSRKLRVGARIKLLQGISNIKTADDFSVSIDTQEDNYHLNIAVDAPVIHTAGLEVDEDDIDTYIMGNSNKGLGFDLGGELELNDKINLSFAINDIGGITWKEEVVNYTANNTEIDFGGLDLKLLDDNDVTDALEDSLKNKFDQVETSDSYSSKLSTRTFIGGTYQVFPRGMVSATISNNFILGKPNTAFGIGYTHQFGKILTLSTTIAKKPHQSPVIGGGFAARFGFFQLYTMVDDFIGYADATSWQSSDVRFGINFLFGRKDKVKKAKSNKQESQDTTPEIETESGN